MCGDRTPTYHARMARHRETHRSGRSGWLRAAVLGSNDAIVSTASLMIGIAASEASTSAILTAGIAGLCAGSMSMAAGEYVSVSSQRDSEVADVAKETRELETRPEAELDELAGIYIARGLDEQLARRVATQLTAHDQLGTHLRDELGIEQHREGEAPANGVDPKARRVKDAHRPHREREHGLRVKVVAENVGHEADDILRPGGTAWLRHTAAAPESRRFACHCGRKHPTRR